MLKYAYVFLLLAYRINCLTYNENTFFINSSPLGYESSTTTDQTIHWNVTGETITFKLVMKTTGWVGFGLSPNGGMKNSDIIQAWTMPDGTVMFKDAHIGNEYHVTYDTVQNWKKLFYLQSNGMTTVIFTRNLKICDADQPADEINIDVEATAYVIYAWGSGFNDGVPAMHVGDNRGSKSLPLLASLNQKISLDMSEIETIEYGIKTIMPKQQTTYFCQMYKLPNDFESIKRHIVRFDTDYLPGQEKHVHHWVLHECSSEFETVYLKNHSMPEPGICSGTVGTTPEWKATYKYCVNGILAWATGGDRVQNFQENLGYPIGGSSSEFKYFHITWHLENNNIEEGIQIEASVKLFFTQMYRPIEFGTYGFGAIVHPQAMTIPPKSKHMTMEYMCRKNSINKLLGENEYVTVFAHFPHTHNQGRSVFSKLIRDNKEIAYIGNNKYYDNEFQYINYLQEPILIRKNDEILLSCVYNTEDLDNFVYGGLGTKEEMCLGRLYYYPRNAKATSCKDFVDINQWIGFFSYLNQTGSIDWHWETDETFFADSMQRIEESSLMNDPERLEGIFQSFFNTANRTQFAADGKSVHGPINVTRMDTVKCVKSLPDINTIDNLLNSAEDRHGLKIWLPILFGVLVVLNNLE